MNAWVRRSLQAGALTAGAVMSAGTAAYADSTLISADNTGLLNGTQVFAPIQAPINLCGIAAAVGGTATAGCEGGSTAIQGLHDVKMISAGNTGILNGTQVYAPIQAPINLCGVAVAVLGDATAGCEGGSTAIIGKGKNHGGHHGCDNSCRGHHGNHGYRESTESTLPKAEVLGSVSGLTQNLPLVGGLTQSLPLVGGLTSGLTQGGGLTSGLTQGGGLPLVGPLVSGLPLVGNLLGGGAGGAANMVDVDALDSVGVVPRSQNESARVTESEGEHTDGGVGGGTGCGSTCPTPPPTTPTPPTQPCPPGHGGHGHGGHGNDVKMISTGNVGILNGTQIYAPIQIPIDVSGIAVGVLGDAAAWSEGGASARM